MSYNPRGDLERFLAEDIGSGDITSDLLSPGAMSARIVAKEAGVLAGIGFAAQIFEIGGASASATWGDGDAVRPDDVVLEVAGTARAVLSSERTALNLLSRMSGIATQTRALAERIRGSGAEIFATRKTAPGLRYFDKIAVEIGGGRRHRMALDEMVMIKDNHLAAGAVLEEVIPRAKRRHHRVEVEVESTADAITAAECGANIIMLDNFTPEQVAAALKALEDGGLRGRVKVEASGRINEENVALYARTGVDMISSGAITSSVRGMDFSLEV